MVRLFWLLLLIMPLFSFAQEFVPDTGFGDYRKSVLDGVLINNDSDPYPELVFPSNGGIYILDNQNGSFTHQTKIVSIPDSLRYFKIKVLDVNNDNKLDIIALRTYDSDYNALEWIEGTSTQALVPGEIHLLNILPADYKTFDAAVTEFLYPDIIVQGSQYVLFYKNLGGGVFDDSVKIQYSSSPTWALDVQWADIYGDGYPDIVLATPYQIYIIDYNGGQNFGSPYTIEWNASMPSHLAIADFDADYDLDIIAANDNGKITLYKNDLGFLTDSVLYQGEFIKGAEGCYPLDFDHDGDIDLMISLFAYGPVFIMKNLGNLTFTVPLPIYSKNYPAISFTRNLLFADIDNDSDYDLINTAYESVQNPPLAVAYYQNSNLDSTCIFLPKWRFSDVKKIDINNDGVQELFIIPKPYDFPRFLFHTQTGWDSLLVLSNNIVRIKYAELIDIDNDNDLDIIAVRDSLKQDIQDLIVIQNLDISSNLWQEHFIGRFNHLKGLRAKLINNTPYLIAFTQDSVFFFSYSGNYQFDSSLIYTTSDFINDVQLADLNNDLYPDVIIGDIYYLKILYGSASGFDSLQIIDTTFSSITAIRTTDFNNDGLLDIAATESYLDFYIQNPDHSWLKDNTFPFLIYEPAQLDICDLNNDNLPDVLTYQPEKQKIVYIINDSLDFLFYDFDLPNQPGAVWGFDYDLDKDNDIIYVTQARDSIYFVKNLLFHIFSQPSDTAVCEFTEANFSVQAELAQGFEWYIKTPDNATFVPLTDNSIYSGTHSSSLTITNVPRDLDGSLFFCKIFGTDDTIYSDTVQLSVYVDTIPPQLIAVSNITIYLDNEGNAILSPEMLVVNATDNCSVIDTSLSRTSFHCGDTLSLVTISITDQAGNIDSTTIIVNISDTIAPELTCPQNTTLTSNDSIYVIQTTEFDAQLTDNCPFSDSLFATVNDTGHYQTLYGLALPLGSHKITWHATDSYGNSSTCQFYLNVQISTYIHDHQLKLFPNPAQTSVTLTLPYSTVATLRLYTINGKLLINQQFNTQTTINLQKLASGIYLVKIITPLKTFTKVLVKN